MPLSATIQEDAQAAPFHAKQVSETTTAGKVAAEVWLQFTGDGAAGPAGVKIHFRRRSFLLRVLDHAQNRGAPQHDESEDSDADTAGGESERLCAETPPAPVTAASQLHGGARDYYSDFFFNAVFAPNSELAAILKESRHGFIGRTLYDAARLVKSKARALRSKKSNGGGPKWNGKKRRKITASDFAQGPMSVSLPGPAHDYFNHASAVPTSDLLQAAANAAEISTLHKEITELNTKNQALKSSLLASQTCFDQLDAVWKDSSSDALPHKRGEVFNQLMADGAKATRSRMENTFCAKAESALFFARELGIVPTMLVTVDLLPDGTWGT